MDLRFLVVDILIASLNSRNEGDLDALMLLISLLIILSEFLST